MTRGAVFAIVLLGANAAFAEQLPPAAVDSKACAPGQRLKPGEESPMAPPTGESLSKKLARTDGVICPPNVDPGIKAPTPDDGKTPKTPVIPPPGSPGGDPTVRPK